MHSDIDALGWIDRVPVLNFLWDVFFDIPPTPEQLVGTLNLMGLVSALLLSIIGGMPFAYGHDDYIAGIARMNNSTFLDWRTGETHAAGTHNVGDHVYQAFTRNFAFGYVALASGLIMVIVIYLFMAHTSFRGPDGRMNTAMLVEWWKYARYVTFFCIVITVLGIVLAYICVTDLLRLMLPAVERPISHPNPFRFDLGTKDSSHKYANMFGILVLIPLPICVFVMAYALYRKPVKLYCDVFLSFSRDAHYRAVCACSRSRGDRTKVFIAIKQNGHASDADDDEHGDAVVAPSASASGGDPGRSIEALVAAVTAGKVGVKPSQRDFAVKMITSLGFQTEADFRDVFYFIDWQRMMPAFPALVELHLKKYFTVELNLKRFS